MRKILLGVILIAALNSHAQSQMELTAQVVARAMAPGWNLGNTMEAGNSNHNFTNSAGLASETWWQDTKTTQDVIDYVKQQGFRSVRIPCAWVMGHISNAADYTIDEAWMNRVKEIVDYCINADLYVVINQHWDGGWLENNIADNSKKVTNKKVLEACWRQIATAFKDYDERLLFAGLNEPNADNQAATNNLIEYEQLFINTVRATGGNNAQRILIIQGPSTNIDHTCNYMAGKLPVDPTANRMMIEVHYYAPWQWWGMEEDASWGKVFFYWGSGNHVTGSQHNATHGEESYVEEQLEMMKKNFGDKGVPVYLGEFGANWRTMPAGENQDKHNASIKSHYQCVVQKAMEKGMVPVIWDTNYRNRPSMTIIDRKHLTIYNTFMMSGITEAVSAATGLWPVTHPNRQTDDSIYNLQGQKVGDPHQAKGIVIQHGSKWISR